MAAAQWTPSSYEKHLVLLESKTGQQLAACMTDGWAERCALLLSMFEAQKEGSWCSFASTRIAFRAMGVTDMSQRQLLDAFYRTDRMNSGVSLGMLNRFLRTLTAELGADVVVQCAAGEDYNSLLTALGSDLLLAEADGSVLLINFLRLLRGSWMGHWSVLGGISHDGPLAYALVIDVAAHRIGPHWVPLPLLASCIATRNGLGEARGYLRLAPAIEADLKLALEASVLEASARAGAQQRASLSHEKLEAIQAEYIADDLPIEVERMSLWSEEQARSFFESGGLNDPDRAPGVGAHSRPHGCAAS